MRPSIVGAARIGSVLSDAASSRAFVCRDCLARTAAIGTPRTQHRYASQKQESIPDRLRKRIWGTDNPPGAKDPYGESRFFKNKEQEEQAQPREQVEAEVEADEDAAAEAYAGTTAEQAMKDDPSYTPAETWDGLDKIGGPTGWWEKAWDEENKFTRENIAQLEHNSFKIVHCAYVEANVLAEAGEDLSSLSRLPKSWTSPLWTVEAQSTERQGVSLSFPDEAWRQDILSLLKPTENVQEVTATEPTAAEAEATVEDLAEPAIQENEELEEADVEPEVAVQTPPMMAPEQWAAEVPSWSQQAQWKGLPLGSLGMKFAIVKRIMQITGHKLSDPVLGRIQTLGELQAELIRKPPHKKLATALAESAELMALPNVHLHENRVGLIDREKAIGRWKTIEAELIKRDLPVPEPGRKRRQRLESM